MCAQRRLNSASASAQSNQDLRCALNRKLRTQGFFIRTAKSLIRLDGCPGWSESSLGAHSFCWFCRAAAQKPFMYVPVFSWATSWETLSSGICSQVRLKPACSLQRLASLQSLDFYILYYVGRCSFIFVLRIWHKRFWHDVAHLCFFFFFFFFFFL